MTYHRVIPAGMKDDNQVPPLPLFRLTQEQSKTLALTTRAQLIDGVICWRNGKCAGAPIAFQSGADGYKQFSVKSGGKYYSFSVHRALWFLHYGEWPKYTIDHINGDRADNRLENLRDIPLKENLRTRAASVAPDAGVYWHKGKRRWRAQIKFDGRCYYIGHFVDRDDAVAASQAFRNRFSPVTPVPAGIGCTRTQSPRVHPIHHGRASA